MMRSVYLSKLEEYYFIQFDENGKFVDRRLFKIKATTPEQLAVIILQWVMDNQLPYGE